MSEETQATAEPLVTYEQRGGVAIISMNRPGVRNAQNADMTFQLDNAFLRAVNDDSVGAIILAGAGDHFSAGHDIGTPLRDIHRNFERRATTYWPHEDKAGAEAIFVREAELYVGMCRRWRELPKPTIAMVQGACIAGGLMLAWVCDLIVASEDAFFADPVLKMGIPGVEYFAHPFVMNPRIAKEFLYLGERMSAARAYEAGMVNRVIPRAELLERTLEIANKLAAQPRFGIALAKRAINQAEDRMGLRDSIDAVYGLHHVAHAHNSLTSPDHLAGQDARSMAAAQRGK
ncbi:MAG: enoyl-CoA hydratase [Deltaproteobacteria bacterium]|nr:enoyl-CoA hydratase [Deltaproteobacteria bacterium]